MPDFPSIGAFAPGGGGVLSTLTELMPMNTSLAGSIGWPTANLAIFVPMRVRYPVTVYKLVVGAGTTATGNFDVGIYDRNGNRLVSSGATAKGASTEHILDVTDTYLAPGFYYLAMSADGTNNYAMIVPSGTSPVPLQKARIYGTLEAATAYTLPATVTMVARTGAFIPGIAAYLRPH